MRDNPLLALLLVFAPLSLVTVGGGQGIVSEIHRQSVNHYRWMTEPEFLDLFALSRLTPGPGSLLVTLVGWRVAGWPGAALASAAIFVPSSILVYAVARVWSRFKGARWQVAIERGLGPVAAGMILAASLTILEAANGGWVAWAVGLGSTVMLLCTDVSPFLLLGAGAATFLLLGA